MKIKKLTLLAMAATMGLFAPAATTTFNEVTVDYGTASKATVSGELVLTYKSSSSLKITGGVVDARVLVVGGGGGGGGGYYYYNSSNKNTETCVGSGGDGGQVVEATRVLDGSLTIVVGAGGAGGASATDGVKGDDSSVKGAGFQDIVARGGYWGEKGANAVTAIVGSGASGDGTKGVKSAITGTEKTYGAGGAIGSGTTVPSAADANSGNGGKGGGTSSTSGNRKGAAGGSGIVIVRITKAMPKVKAVDDLTITETFVTSSGETFSPISSVPEGVELTGETSSSALGYHQFVASLKSGYIWRNGLVDTPRAYNWRIVEKADDIPWINATKLVRVDPEHPSNAWIAVRGMVPQVQKVPNVLFIGTECYAHSLTAKNLQKAIEAVATVANIDWHIFKSTTQTGKAGEDRHGQLLQGETFESRGLPKLVFDTNNHHAARRFYETLDNVRTNETLKTKYDYIILEFDGSRLADQYTQGSDSASDQIGAYKHEAEVAAFLKRFYAEERVIWMVDNHAAGADVEPWDSDYYRPNLYFHNNYNNTLTDAEYKGLIGLLDPESYSKGNTAEELSEKVYKEWQPTKCLSGSYLWYDKGDYAYAYNKAGGAKAKRKIYANRKYQHQVFYDDGATLNNYLLNFIQQRFQLLFLDKVVKDLDIVSATFYRSAARDDGQIVWDDSEGWEKVADIKAGSKPTYYNPGAYVDNVLSAKLAINGQEISAGLSNLVEAAWGKMEIYVKDRGTFKDGVEPVYDEATGKWLAEKNPNDGLASIEKTDPAGETTAYGDAPAKIQWDFPMYLIEGIVTNGTLKIDGVETNETYKAEGYDCSVTYVGDKGYALEYITVDGKPLTEKEINDHISEYGFTNIHADHKIVVVYTNFVATSQPYSNYYDGVEHTITVTPPETFKDITNVKVLYSTTEDGEYTETPPVYSNVSHNVVYYKVVGDQVGYPDPVELDKGSDTVDILPREVNVIAKSAKKFYDGKELTAGYEVQYDYSGAEGWGFIGDDDITTIKMTAESVIGADAAKTERQAIGNVIDPDQTKFTSDEIAGNYIVHYTNGELEVIPVDVKPVVKIYDGIPTNVEVTVTEPPAGTTIKYSYTEDGQYVEAGELTFTGPTNVWEGADREIWVEVSAPGYGALTNHATATILPRVVVEQAGSATNAYTGARLECSNATERADLESVRAAEMYKDYPELDPADAEGFADGEGFVKAADGNTYLEMTKDSWRIDVGETNNVIKAEQETIEGELNGQTSYGNYLFFFEDGELVVTNGTLTVTAFPAEKFYDGMPTNITFTVKDPDGNEVVPDEVYFKGPGDEKWIPAEDFHKYTNATNFPDGEGVPVEVKVVKENYTDAFAESTVTVWPRPVILVAATDAKVWDGEPLTNWTCTVKNDATTAEIPGYGFVNEDGVEKGIRMTPESTQTEIGVHSNVIVPGAEVPTGTTDLRNYTISYEPGSLLVVGSTPYVGEYDAKGHTITVTVPPIDGVDPDKVEIRYSLSETGPFESADEIPWTDVVEGKKVYYQVTVKGTGYPPVVGESTIDITPVPVVIVSNSGEKAYDGKALTNWTGVATITTNGVTTTFDVGTEVPLLGDDVIDLAYTGTQTEVGSSSNTFDYAFRDEPKSANYTVTTNYGELVVTPAALTVEAFPAKKFYDGDPTNITFTVKDPDGNEVIPDEVYFKGPGDEKWIPAEDFHKYTNATNFPDGEGVPVEVKVVKENYSPAETSSTVTVWPRPVILVAATDAKVWDGEPLTNWTCTVKNDATTAEIPGYGFVNEDGVEKGIRMTPESTQTEIGVHSNVIVPGAEVPTGTTDLRNYTISYEPGSLLVVGSTPYVGEYDAKGHTITVTVPPIDGVDPDKVEIRYSLSETGPFESADEIPWTDVVEGKKVYYQVTVKGTGYPPVVGESTIDITPVPVHIVSNDDSKYFDGDPLTNWTGVATITTNGVTTTFDVGTEVPLLGDDVIDLAYTGTQTEVGSSPNTFTYAFAEGTEPSNYIVTIDEGVLEVIQREEEVQRDEDFEKLPEKTKEAIKEADKKVNEILEELTEADQEKSGEPFVKYQLTVTKKDDLTEKDRTVPSVADVDAEEQVKEIVKKTGKTPDVSEYVDVILERTYDKEEATNRQEKGKDGYDKAKWDQLDEAKDHNDVILSVMFPYEVPDGMELLGVTRSCHPDNDYDPEDATHGLLTAVPKVPEAQKPTKEGFYYDPETKTITLYAKDFCLFGFHLRVIPTPPPVKPCDPCDPCDSCCNTCGSPCGWGYRVKVIFKTTAPKSQVSIVSCCGVSGNCNSCYRKPTTRRYIGYVFGKTSKSGSACCTSCGCNTWDTFDLVAWSYESKRAVTFKNLSLLQFNRYGESRGSDVEMSFRVKGSDAAALGLCDLVFSGFGKMGTRTDGTFAVKSVSGFCAGVLPQFCEKITKDACGEKIVGRTRSKIWSVCGQALYSGTTAAYGKWLMAWDSAITSRISAGRIRFAAVAEEGDFDYRTLAVSGYVPSGYAATSVYYVEDGQYAGEDEEASFDDLRDMSDHPEWTEEEE